MIMKKITRSAFLVILFLTTGIRAYSSQEKSPINTPPQISGIPDVVVSQNTIGERVIDLWKYTVDSDTPLDKVLFSLVVPNKNRWEGSARAHLDENRYVNISPDANWTGTEIIAAEANDGTTTNVTTFRVIVVPVEAGESVEAEDLEKIERRGNWVEFSEGNTRWLQSNMNGDALCLKFKGSFVAIKFLSQSLNVMHRYYDEPGFEPFNDWKTYRSGVASIMVDGKETSRVDLSDDKRKGWNEYLVASNLEPSEHDLEIVVCEGSVIVDKIRTSTNPLCEINVLVADSYQTPLADVVIKFVQNGKPNIIMRTGPDGKSQTFYGLKPGTYDITIEPGSSPGYVPAPSKIEENVISENVRGVEFKTGQKYWLRYSLEYSIPDLRSLKIIRRPIGTMPTIAKRGEIIEIVCRYPHSPGRIRGFLFKDDHEEPLDIVSVRYAPKQAAAIFEEQLYIGARIPFGIAESLYGLKIIIDEDVDSASRAVSVISDFKRDYRIIQLSDLHIQSSRDDRKHEEMLIKATQLINLMSPAFVIITGDITDSGSRPEYLRFIKAIRQISVPTYVIPGNHDHYYFSSRNFLSLGFDEYEKYLGRGFFSFGYGSDHFIGLDTGDYERIYDTSLKGIHADQWSWLLRDIEQSSGHPEDLLCLFAHYDYTARLPEYMVPARQLLRVIDTNPVDLAIHGHSHVNREETIGRNSTISLETASLIDGYFRLIEIREGNVASHPIMDTEKFKVEFVQKNDGSNKRVKALIKNDMDFPLTDVTVKFMLKNADQGFKTNRGQIVDTLICSDGTKATISVAIDVQAHSEVMLEVFPAGY